MSKSSLQRLPPAPEEALPVLTSLTKAAPSPLLQWQLLDILYSYAFVMRVYNGEYSTDGLVRLIVLRLQCAAVCCTNPPIIMKHVQKRLLGPHRLGHCTLQIPVYCLWNSSMT